MGDRGNIVIRFPRGYKEDKFIFFYTHWGGSEIKQILQNALIRGQERWDDPPYLSRIIFNEMTKGEEMELTGFGISPTLCDNEHPILVVNTDKGIVEEFDESGCDRESFFGEPNKIWTFEEFCNEKHES